MLNLKPKMKSVVDGFQYMIILLSVSCLMLILISMTVNDKNSKYVKSHYDECKYHSILDLYEEGSHICCDSKHHRSSWLCIASFDSVNKILSSHWAFLLPLLPYLTTISIKPNHSINVDVKRLFAYIAILLYRTVILYMIPYYVEGYLQSSSSSSQLMCWCKDFVSSSKCRLLFDFSDHIVLSMVQYMLPCVLEIHYVLYRRHSNIENSKDDSGVDSYKNNKKDSYGEDSTSISSYSNSYGAPFNNAISTASTSTDQFSPVISSFLTILVSIIIMLGSLRSIVFTSMFFHTRLENIAAFVIVILFVYLPMYSSRIVKIWVREILQ